MRFGNLTILTAAAALFAGTASAQTVSLATTKTGGANNVAMTVLSKAVGEKHGLQIRVIPMTGMETYGPGVDAGRIDTAGAPATDVAWAMTGTGAFKGKKMPNIRLVAALYSAKYAWMVQKDSPIKTIAGLKGKRVPITFSSQYSAGRHAMGALASAGLSEKDVDGVPVPNVLKAGDLFAQGKTDVTWFIMGAGKVKQIASQVGGIRYLPLVTTPEGVAAMRKFTPGASVVVAQPHPGDPGIVGPTPAMTEFYYMIANKNVADDVVAGFLDVLYNDQDKLAAGVPLWKNYDPKELYRSAGDLPWHPGAEKWFQAHGLKLVM